MTISRRQLLQGTGAAGVAVIGASILPKAASASEFTLRLHQFLPAQANVPAHVLDVWADTIEEQSGGRITVERYPSMQLGGTPPDLIDQCIDGIADVVWTVAGYTPGRFPRTEVFELPFMMTSAGPTSRAYWTMAERHMMDADFAEFKPIAVWVHGPGLIHSADPIRTPDDLNGVKLRAPTRVTNQMFSNLGATTVGMPVPAIPEALSRGVVDATVIPWEVVGILRVQELVENHTVFPNASLYTTSFIFGMNQASYDALPADLQAVIDANSGADFSEFAGRTMQEFDEPSRQAAIDRGNNIIELTPEEVDMWREAAQPTIDAWVAEMDEAGMDGSGLLAEARALIAEYSA